MKRGGDNVIVLGVKFIFGGEEGRLFKTLCFSVTIRICKDAKSSIYIRVN